MTYLVDTHIIIWALFEPDRLSNDIKQILENDTDLKAVSGISLWEISLKYSLGKLELSELNPDQVLEAIRESGFEVLELSSELMASYYQLPKREDHRDPFDRMLVWQSIALGYTLISHDSKIKQYVPSGLRLITNS